MKLVCRRLVFDLIDLPKFRLFGRTALNNLCQRGLKFDCMRDAVEIVINDAKNVC